MKYSLCELNDCTAEAGVDIFVRLSAVYKYSFYFGDRWVQRCGKGARRFVFIPEREDSARKTEWRGRGAAEDEQLLQVPQDAQPGLRHKSRPRAGVI